MNEPVNYEMTEGVVKAVIGSEQVNNLTLPFTKRVGIFFDDIFSLVFGGWTHELAEKSRLKHEKNIEDFKKKLNTDLSQIPEENRVFPKTSIVGPALEASKYYFEEDEIRDMFEKLIVSSMDSRKATKVHPSFTEIIKQMSPLDAQNIKLFKLKPALPIVEYQVKLTEGYSTIVTNVFLENPECQDIDLQSVSVASLERVGLVTIDYDCFFVKDSFYSKYETHYCFTSLCQDIEQIKSNSNSTVKEAKIQKGQIALTPLGEAFINVCLSPLSGQSNPQPS